MFRIRNTCRGQALKLLDFSVFFGRSISAFRLPYVVGTTIENTLARPLDVKLAHTAEFAAMISAHANTFINSANELPDWALGRFHRCSRARLHRWMRGVSKAESKYLNGDPGQQDVPDHSLVEMANRILVGEILNRVWVATLIGWDREHNVKCAEPIARNVMLGHMLSRHQLLSVVGKTAWITQNQRASIEATYSSVQRWSDLLTSHLLARYDLWDLAFDEERARDFAEMNDQQDICDPASRVWTLILVSLRMAFPDRADRAVFATDLDREIVRAVIATFPPQLLERVDQSTVIMAP